MRIVDVQRMKNTAPLTAREQLAETANHCGWDVIGAGSHADKFYCRRTPFTISVQLSRTGSVVSASFWIDPPTGTKELMPRCLRVIAPDSEDKCHKIEVWMVLHGQSSSSK